MQLSILHSDIVTLVKSAGYIGLFLIIFSESGLFFGFFLPGGSLLFTAGLLASQGLFNIWILIGILGLAAILGDNVGYWFGAHVGPKIFSKEDSYFFHKKHIERTQLFYAKYGPRALILSRFVPVIRTFAPILAGVGKMNYGKFVRYNILGALLWAVGVSWLGYFLGTKIPNAEVYLLPIIATIIILSLLPLFTEWLKSRRRV